MKTQPVRVQPESARQRLANTVRGALGSSLGTGFPSYVSSTKTELRPIAIGVIAAGLYALLPLLQMCLRPSSPQLVLLSWWGVVYLGLVVMLTRRTSAAVVEIVEVLLIPNISEEFANTVRENIEKNFSRPRTFMKSLAAASAAMLISCALLWQFRGIQLFVWGVGFFILYFTASQATLTAPFYTCFSISLKKHSNILFAVDPATSPAVIGCTALAKRILSYWFVVFVLVMSLTGIPYLMSLPIASSFACASPAGRASCISYYISAVVFIAGFFSFCFGSLVYLRFESDLRIAVDRVRLATLSEVQGRYREISSNREGLSPEEWLRIDRLKGTSDYLSRSGYLRGSLQRVAIVVATILPPVVSLVGAVLTFFQKK
jgi:hypothetical protein